MTQELQILQALRAKGHTGLRIDRPSGRKPDAHVVQVVQDAVEVAEAVVKGRKQGPLKRQLVVRLLEGILPPPVPVGLLVDLAVALLNRTWKRPPRARKPRAKKKA